MRGGWQGALEEAGMFEIMAAPNRSGSTKPMMLHFLAPSETTRRACHCLVRVTEDWPMMDSPDCAATVAVELEPVFTTIYSLPALIVSAAAEGSVMVGVPRGTSINFRPESAVIVPAGA